MSSDITTSSTTQSSINITNTQSTDTQSSNVSINTTITSISTTTTSNIIITTTTTTSSITTSNSFFTDTNSNSFTTTNSKNLPTTVSGNVPSISTLIPEENINKEENNNDIVIFGVVFGTILLALFGCIFLIYFIRRKKDKEKENVLVYNPKGSKGLINSSEINDIQQTRISVQPQNRSSNYAGEIVELVEISDCNNTQNNLFVPFNKVSNTDNLNTHQIQQNNELQNMYNNTVQMNLVNNIVDDGIKFAETMNRDSLENNNYKNKNNSGVTRSLNLPV